MSQVQRAWAFWILAAVHERLSVRGRSACNTAGAEVPPGKVELSLCPIGNGESFQRGSNDWTDVLGRELGTCWEGELVEEETDRARVCL